MVPLADCPASLVFDFPERLPILNSDMCCSLHHRTLVVVLAPQVMTLPFRYDWAEAEWFADCSLPPGHAFFS